MRKIIRNRNSFLSVIVITLIVSCISQQKSTTNGTHNLATLYNPLSSNIHPKYQIYNSTDTTSEVLINLNTEELLFNKANQKNILLSKIGVTYKLYYIENNFLFSCDSGTLNVDIPKDNVLQNYFVKLNIKTNQSKLYSCRLVIFDLMRDQRKQLYFDIDKTDDFASSNYKIMNPVSHEPIFGPLLKLNEKFTIFYHKKKTDHIFIKYYRKNMDAGIHTDSTHINISNCLPDSVWKLPYSESQLFQLLYEGIYIFSIDSLTNKGLTLINFGNIYPDIKTINELVEPLKYIATREEFIKITGTLNIKQAIDQFWLNRNKNTGQAKELIKVYYNRVKVSNDYFTSDKEGWRTDRGMIYVLFGPPNTILKSEIEEKWIYYTNKRSIEFVFKHQINCLSQNYYEMEINPLSLQEIQLAVTAWKNGKLYP